MSSTSPGASDGDSDKFFNRRDYGGLDPLKRFAAEGQQRLDAFQAITKNRQIIISATLSDLIK